MPLSAMRDFVVAGTLPLWYIMVNIISGEKSVPEKVNAAVRTAPQTTEFREYDMPDIPDEAALLKFSVL